MLARRDICRPGREVGLEPALCPPSDEGLDRGCESKICTCRSRVVVCRGIVIPRSGLGGTPTLREVGEGESDSSALICDSTSGIEITACDVRCQSSPSAG